MYFLLTFISGDMYDQADAPIAQLLTPISGKDLKGVTVLGSLFYGSKLTFDQIKTFNNHVKIHLANDGADYGVILVAGNVGANFNAESAFVPSKITV